LLVQSIDCWCGDEIWLLTKIGHFYVGIRRISTGH
jgi:hypothetical protein